MAKYFSCNELFQDLFQLVMMSRKSKGLKHHRDLLIFLQFIITWLVKFKEQVTW